MLFRIYFLIIIVIILLRLLLDLCSKAMVIDTTNIFTGGNDSTASGSYDYIYTSINVITNIYYYNIMTLIILHAAYFEDNTKNSGDDYTSNIYIIELLYQWV